MKDIDQKLLYLWYQQHKNYDLDNCLQDWVDVLRRDLKAPHNSNPEDYLSDDQNFLPDYFDDNSYLKNSNSFGEVQPPNLNLGESKSSKVSLRRHSFPRSKNKTAEIALSLGLQPHDSVCSWGSMLTPRRQKETPLLIKSLSASFIEQMGSTAKTKVLSRSFAKYGIPYREDSTFPMGSCDLAKGSQLGHHSPGDDFTDENRLKTTEPEGEDLDEKLLSVSAVFSRSRIKPICSSTPILPRLDRLYTSEEEGGCRLTGRQIPNNMVSLSKSVLLMCTPISKGQTTACASVQTLGDEEKSSEEVKITGFHQVPSQSPDVSSRFPVVGDSLSRSDIIQGTVRKFHHIKKKIRPKFIYPRIDEENQSLDDPGNILQPMQSPGLKKMRLEEPKETILRSEGNKTICQESRVLKHPSVHCSIDEHKGGFQTNEEPNQLPKDTMLSVPDSSLGPFNCESPTELIKDTRKGIVDAKPEWDDDWSHGKTMNAEQICEKRGYDSNGKTTSQEPISTTYSNAASSLKAELELHDENPDLPFLDDDWNNEEMTQPKVMAGKKGIVSTKWESSRLCPIDANRLNPEIPHRSLCQLDPGEEKGSFHISSVLQDHKIDGTKVSPNQTSATLLQCTSKSEMPGFTTASGKGIKVNPQLLLKANCLWEEIETGGNAELFPGTPVANKNPVMKQNSQKQTTLSKCPKMPLTTCFTTSSGKGVQVNSKHVLDAKLLLEDVDSWDGNAELLRSGTPVPNDRSGDKNGMNQTSASSLNCTSPPEAPCFKTASGKGIQVNRKLLLKSKRLWTDIDTSGENPHPLPGTSIPNCHLDESENRPNLASATPTEYQEIPQMPSFKTASGKGIKVNPNLLLKAKRLWEDIDSSDGNDKDPLGTPVPNCRSLQNENSDLSPKPQKRSASPILGSQKSKRNIGPLMNSSCSIRSQLFHQGCVTSEQNVSFSMQKERNQKLAPTKLKQVPIPRSIPFKSSTLNETQPMDYSTQNFAFPKPADAPSICCSTQEKAEITEITEAFVRDSSWDNDFAGKR